MILKDQHIEFIENNLKLYGVKSKDLREDLLDHICTYIETNDTQDFDSLYQEALQKFGCYTSFQNLQLETNLQKFAQHTIRLKRALHLVSTIAVLLIMIGLLFKVMHWPFATILLFSGCVVFILVVIPTYFYDRYKSSIHKFS
jgi:hypothetical protein